MGRRPRSRRPCRCMWCVIVKCLQGKGIVRTAISIYQHGDSIARHDGGSVRAVMLVGHGSLRLGAGAAMIRLAERAQAARVAPIVGAGFLNYSRPTFGETL